MSATDTLCSLPRGWKSVRLKWLLSALESGRREVSDTDDFADGVLSIGGEHIGWKGEWFLDNPRFVSVPFYEALTTGKIRENDVLLVKDGATIGKLAIADKAPAERAAVNEHVFLLRFKPDNCPKFYFYYMQSSLAQAQVQLEVQGSAQPGLNSQFAGVVRAPWPPVDEQRRLARVLEVETAKIDASIAAKENLLNLLAEKRRALISHAVTRGLDPAVPTRDSGLPWLGRIPRHWELNRLKYLTSEITVGIVVTPAKYYEDSGIPCLRSLNVRETGLTDKDLVYISQESNEELAKSKIFKGDLVIVRTGQPGTTAVVDDRFDGANCIDLIIVRRTQLAISDFLAHFLNSAVATAEFFCGSGGAIQQHFNIEIARDVVVPLPPLDEQREIVGYSVRETAKLDALRTAADHTIGLLKERRSALIAEAVTGRLAIEGVCDDAD